MTTSLVFDNSDIDSLRKFAKNEYKLLYPEGFLALENMTYNYAIERTKTTDTIYLIEFYKQIFMKVHQNPSCFMSFKTLDEFISSLERSKLNPDKWLTLYKNRTDVLNIKKKKGQTQCPKCKSWYTSHTESQTRSADESTTISVLCSECGYRFSFS